MGEEIEKWCRNNKIFIRNNLKHLQKLSIILKEVGLLDEAECAELDGEGPIGFMTHLSWKITNPRYIKSYLQPLKDSGNVEMAEKLEKDFAHILSQPMSWEDCPSSSENRMEIDSSSNEPSKKKLKVTFAPELTEKRLIHGRDYDFEKCIGVGGFGFVFRAKRKETGELVAIKIMHQGPSKQKEMVKREISLLQVTSITTNLSPFVVKYIEHEEVDGAEDVLQLWPDIRSHLVYNGRCIRLVMELMDGSLLDWIRRMHGLEDAEYLNTAQQILYQVMTGLAELHGRSTPIIHRDLKPENILLKTLNGGKEVIAKIGDLGLARTISESRKEKLTTGVGTMWFVSPEQRDGSQYSSKTDVYSMGKVIAELIWARKLPVEELAKGRESYLRTLDDELLEAEFRIQYPFWGALHSLMTLEEEEKRIGSEEVAKVFHIRVNNIPQEYSESGPVITNLGEKDYKQKQKQISNINSNANPCCPCSFSYLDDSSGNESESEDENSEIEWKNNPNKRNFIPMALKYITLTGIAITNTTIRLTDLISVIAMHNKTLKIIELNKIKLEDDAFELPRIALENLENFEFDVKFEDKTNLKDVEWINENLEVVESFFFFTKGGKTLLENPEMLIEKIRIYYGDHRILSRDKETLILPSLPFFGRELIAKSFQGKVLQASLIPFTNLPPQITKLNLIDVELSDFPDWISHFPYLESLNISFTENSDSDILASVPLNDFSPPNLKSLCVKNAELDLNYYEILRNLEKLVLIKTDLSGELDCIDFSFNVLKKLVITPDHSGLAVGLNALKSFVRSENFLEMYLEFGDDDESEKSVQMVKEALKGVVDVNFSQRCANVHVYRHKCEKYAFTIDLEESVKGFVKKVGKDFYL